MVPDPNDPNTLIRETDKYLGTEIDLKLFLKVATSSQISIGGAVFAPGSVLKRQEFNGEKLDKTATWGYAMATVNF